MSIASQATKQFSKVEIFIYLLGLSDFSDIFLFFFFSLICMNTQIILIAYVNNECIFL